MPSKYSEYSRLRSIARKRSERLGEAGLIQEVKFPTVAEIKQKGISPEKALQAVNKFLNAPTTKRSYLRLPEFIQEDVQKVVKTVRSDISVEKQKARKREANRRYKENVVKPAREAFQQLSPRKQEYYKRFLKSAKFFKVNIPVKDRMAFYEYLDARLTIAKENQAYRIDIYIKEFENIQNSKKYSPEEIMEDFRGFLAERDIMVANAEEMKGYGVDVIDDLFKEFLKS